MTLLRDFFTAKPTHSRAVFTLWVYTLLETVLITYVIVILRSRDRTHAVD